MKCNAIVTVAPDNVSMSRFDVEDISGAKVKVAFSSLCSTDHQVFSGELLYYKNNVAKYPIVTGHEWCGEYEGSPVTGLCILGCGSCCKCNNDQAIHCDSRKEVGIVNKHGAHAEYVFMPQDSLIPIPSIAPKYSLLEPLAVCIHALNRIPLESPLGILIVGYGCIGRLCGEVLKTLGYDFTVYDPRFTDEVDADRFDIILECSGNIRSLIPYLRLKGITIVLFGFEYNSIDPSVLTSNEITMVGTLGSSRRDFEEAVEIMKQINPDFFHIHPFDMFNEGVKLSRSGNKVIFKH